MSDYVIEESGDVTNDAGTFRALVLSDPENPFNPRKDSAANFGVMVAHVWRHALPEEDGPVPGAEVLAAIGDHSFRVVARWLRVFHGATVVLPLYHAGGNGGVVLAPGSGAEGEDASAGNYVGVVYDSPEHRADLLPDARREDVVKWLRAEVLQYNAWANGDMTAYRVDRTTNPGDDEVWELVDSCGGYFTVEDARNDAVAQMNAIARHALADHMEAVHGEALDENEIEDLRAAEMA